MNGQCVCTDDEESRVFGKQRFKEFDEIRIQRALGVASLNLRTVTGHAVRGNVDST